MKVLLALSFSHLLNDTIQSLLPAIYPLLKESFSLNFTQIGLITLTFQLTASILQPVVGVYTDRRPKPYSLAIGMGVSLCGLVLLARAPNYASILGAAAMVGLGSSIFHPEASRVARLASGGRHGFAQALFQVGGNLGSSIGPLLAALIIVPRGQSAIIWFSSVAIVGILLLSRVGGWYQRLLARRHGAPLAVRPAGHAHLSRRQVIGAVAILLVLIFSKFFYTVSLSNYYTFYLIEKFHTPVRTAQVYLFIFLFAVAAGTILGGPIGDRYGRKAVIWGSILGVAPFTLLLPHVNLFWTIVLTILVGLILSSAFSAILVYAQELVPGKVGTVAGLFFGFAFGMGGLGSALLGSLADYTSIIFVFKVCAFLPLLGLLAAFLPDLDGAKKQAA
ncbi:MAG: MFS transporter [Opitutae bacterium]|nr:MFS transporter [Opitutae bacterium]